MVTALRSLGVKSVKTTVDHKKVEDYWAPSKTLMNGPFVQSLRNYDVNNIPAETLAKVQRVIAANPHFTVADVSRVSSAAAGLCQWVLGVVAYAAALAPAAHGVPVAASAAPVEV